MRHLVGLTLLLILLAPARPATATTLLQVDLHTLVRLSDRVVVGRVLSSRSFWSEDGRRIVTEHRVAVEQDLGGGKGGDVLVIRTQGGKVGSLRMQVRGAPVLRKGQRMLLFTELRGGHRWVVGMTQGAMEVAPDGRGRLMVTRRLGGVRLVRRDSRGRMTWVDPASLTPRPRELSLMAAEIRATWARRKTEAGSCQSR